MGSIRICNPNWSCRLNLMVVRALFPQLPDGSVKMEIAEIEKQERKITFRIYRMYFSEMVSEGRGPEIALNLKIEFV